MAILEHMDESCDFPCTERRVADRRKRRMSFVLHERRTGFDRRRSTRVGFAAVLENALLDLRDRPRFLGVLLGGVNLFNFLDFSLTLNVLAAGGAEANPLMRSLFGIGSEWAGAFKILAVLVATIILWRYRYFRTALAAACLLFALFSAVLLYHLALAVTAF